MTDLHHPLSVAVAALSSCLRTGGRSAFELVPGPTPDTVTLILDQCNDDGSDHFRFPVTLTLGGLRSLVGACATVARAGLSLVRVETFTQDPRLDGRPAALFHDFGELVILVDLVDKIGEDDDGTPIYRTCRVQIAESMIRA